MNNSVSVFQIPQLKDNYSYLLVKDNKAIIVDPAESFSILEIIKSKKLTVEAILITHHHSDHTAGIKNILNLYKVPVYTPSKDIHGTSNIISDKQLIKFSFINFKVLETPGHTLDHVVYYNKKNNILISGDTLFRLGCGRVFEGTYTQMYRSLKKIRNLDNKTKVYCGHEYTLNNLEFLLSIFSNNKNLIKEVSIVKRQLKKTNSSIPFNLGDEKAINPFLSSESQYFKAFKKNNNLSDLALFKHLRDLKNNF